jgi:hypothetical protein
VTLPAPTLGPLGAEFMILRWLSDQAGQRQAFRPENLQKESTKGANNISAVL